MLYKVLKKIIALFFYIVTFIVPKNKNIWVTGKTTGWMLDKTPPNFFDNSKYFYLYLVNHTNEKVYWISNSDEEIKLLKSMNLPVLRLFSLKGIWTVLRAKYCFHHYGIDQINKSLQNRSVQINFWHGIPLKKIRYDVIEKPVNRFIKLKKIFHIESNEYVLSSSKYLTNQIFKRAFDVDDSHILNYGYPRTDTLKFNKDELYKFCLKYSKDLVEYIDNSKKFDYVYLYMPTYRDDDPDYFLKANINFKELSDKLRDLNAVLYFKLHPLTNSINLPYFANIISIKNDVDIYPFLPFTDCLVTDYSSIMFDYLLLDKKIEFIPYDFENYINNREIYFDYFNFIPGVAYNNFDEFIKNMKIDKKYRIDKQTKLKEMFFDKYDYDACEKTYNYFKNS